MTKKKVIVCDVCGKMFSPYNNGQIKLKIRDDNYVVQDDWEYRKWRKWDICPDCAKKLLLAVSNMLRDDNDKVGE